MDPISSGNWARGGKGEVAMPGFGRVVLHLQDQVPAVAHFSATAEICSAPVGWVDNGGRDVDGVNCDSDGRLRLRRETAKSCHTCPPKAGSVR